MGKSLNRKIANAAREAALRPDDSFGSGFDIGYEEGYVEGAVTGYNLGYDDGENDKPHRLREAAKKLNGR